MGNQKNTAFGRRAWKLLRLAFLWARKGGVFRTKLMMDLRLLTSHIKEGLRRNTSSDRIHYMERQFSFDDTPIFHFKTQRSASMRFRISCLNPPPVDFDDDLLFNNNNQYDNGRKSLLLCDKDEEGNEDAYDNGRKSSEVFSCQKDLLEDEEEEEEEEGGIDFKAEAFIAQFYQHLKLQRQISYTQYNDMLNRGIN